MTNTDKKYTRTLMGETKSSNPSPCHAGAPAGTDHYTYRVYRQDWHAGDYAGRSYKIVETWMSNNPTHRGQLINTTSEPWPTTRTARLMNQDTGTIFGSICPIPLEVNDAGECIDSGPLDATLDGLAADGATARFIGVWDDTHEPVICSD